MPTFKKNPIIDVALTIPNSKVVSGVASEAGIKESVQKLQKATEVVREKAAEIANGNNKVKLVRQQSKGQPVEKEQEVVNAPKRPSK